MIYINYCRWYCPFLLCIPQRVLLGGLSAEAAVGFACAGGEGLSSLNTWWAEGASVGCLETNQSSALVGEQPPICPFGDLQGPEEFLPQFQMPQESIICIQTWIFFLPGMRDTGRPAGRAADCSCLGRPV